MGQADRTDSELLNKELDLLDRWLRARIGCDSNGHGDGSSSAKGSPGLVAGTPQAGRASSTGWSAGLAFNSLNTLSRRDTFDDLLDPSTTSCPRLTATNVLEGAPLAGLVNAEWVKTLDEVLIENRVDAEVQAEAMSNGRSSTLCSRKRCVYGRSCPVCSRLRQAVASDSGPDLTSTVANVPSENNGSGVNTEEFSRMEGADTFGAAITGNSRWIEEQTEAQRTEAARASKAMASTGSQKSSRSSGGSNTSTNAENDRLSRWKRYCNVKRHSTIR